MESLQLSHTRQAARRRDTPAGASSASSPPAISRFWSSACCRTTNVEVEIATAVAGFGDVWEAVIADFVERASPGGLRFSINDGGRAPDTVTLRLMQACALMEDSMSELSKHRRGRAGTKQPPAQRIAALLDPPASSNSSGPSSAPMSPHLPQFDLPGAFDDGMIVGRGRSRPSRVLVAAQEGRFMGGAFGEVHGAKLVGLLRAARARICTRAVLLLLDTGGVRLQEANAGELAIAEIMRAMLEARGAGVAVVGLIGGRAGLLRRRRADRRLLQSPDRLRARPHQRERPGGDRDQQGRRGIRCARIARWSGARWAASTAA